MDRDVLLERARTRGVNPALYWAVRAILQPFFHLYFRLRRTGREHIPPSGPVIVAANHRSFLDPFVIAVMARRPIYFVAKKEIFVIHPVVTWLLGSLGAFPIDRGGSDQQAMATAKAILERGDAVLMFPEGTRVRPGSLGRPKRGVGRLALETGAPVVPVAVHGTEAVRRGWRFRPHRVSIRAGRALTFPRVERPSPALAGAVTDRIWPCVELQWEWLGGLPRLRRAGVIGSGPRATSIADALTRAGLEVEIGATGAHDVVVFAVPARELPEALAEHAHRVPGRAGAVVVRPPAAGSDLEDATARLGARAVASVHTAADAAGAIAPGDSVVVAGSDEAFLAQLADVLRRGGLKVARGSAGIDTTTTTRARRRRAA